MFPCFVEVSVHERVDLRFRLSGPFDDRIQELERGELSIPKLGEGLGCAEVGQIFGHEHFLFGVDAVAGFCSVHWTPLAQPYRMIGFARWTYA